MNDTRDNTMESSARTTSMDALSRTIDSLESRIERLVAHQHGKQRNAPPPNPSGTPRETGAAEAIQREIVDRQRMLDRERAELETRLAARRPAGPVDATADKTLREIAESLVSLREELKSDIADGLTREIAGLREEIGALKSSGGQPLPPMMRDELVRLADCIERLGENGPHAGDDGLMKEVQGFRAALEHLADDSAERLGAVEQRIGEIDPKTMRGEIAAMAARVEDLQAAMSRIAETMSGHEIEEQLKSVTTSLATLAEQVNLDDAAIDHRFTELGQRLDEISQAIVSVGTRSDRTKDAETLSRIEQRLEGLMHHMDSTNLEAMEGLTARVSVLMESINSLASEESVSALGARLDQLSSMLEQGNASQDEGNLAVRLMEISDKIDLLGEGAVSDALAGRLDDLAKRIDNVADRSGSANQALVERIETLMWQSDAPDGAPAAGIESLEERLTEIARRLDETRTAPADQAALHSLETQIAHLSELLGQSGASAGLEEAAVQSRLSVLEEHLETNDEYIIEAARQAAESVVAAYGRRPAGEAGNPGEIAAITELAEDLRALERLSQQSDDRTARAFDAVHDTLIKIADHLENLGNTQNSTPAMPEPAAVDAAASQEDEDEELAAVFGRRETSTASPVDVETHTDTDTTDIDRDVTASAAVSVEAAEDDRLSDVISATAEDDGNRTAGETGKAPARRGLLASLGGRLRKRRDEDEDVDEETAASARADVEDAPALDPSEAFESDESDLSDAMSSNEPLEPGSGVPDLDRIFRKTRDNREMDGDAPIDNADFIAAARRAAQAAAAEAETTEAAGRKKRGGLKGLLQARRRSILLAAGAILLVVMAWPLASTLIERHEGSGAAKAPAKQVADATPPNVSSEKTGATATGDPALPKVTPLSESVEAGPAAQAGGSDPAPTAGNEAPAGSAPNITDTSPAMATPLKAAASQKPAMEAAAPAPETTAPAGSTSAPQTAAASSAKPEPETAAATAADAGATAQVASDAKPGTAEGSPVAVPQIPEAVGPQSLRLAAEKGDSKALFEIGTRYTDGSGVSVDLKEAAKWYEAAAGRGLAPAEYRLANFYEKGQGVVRDTDRARDWYKKAADQGNVSAMHNLAVLDAMGRGGKPDYTLAAEWFRKAADHGVKDSQYNLAILYAQGRGVPRDPAESYKWFALAASDGDSDARHKRDQVAATMSRDALTKARAVVSEWKPQPVDPVANTVDIPPAWSGKDTTTASIDMSKAVRNIQVILDNNGFDAGTPDGIMGAKTRAAIKAFQKSVGQEPTGDITDDLVKKLLALNKKQQKNS